MAVIRWHQRVITLPPGGEIRAAAVSGDAMHTGRSETGWFGQVGYRCRLEWGRRGAEAAADRGDVLVVVDTLSFSTAVATAAQRGVLIYPCPPEDDPHALGERVGAEVAVKRHEVPGRGRFSLSPGTFAGAAAGTRVVVPSPNGSACRSLARRCPVVVGCPADARAVAAHAAALLASTGRAVTVLACGERWPEPAHDEGLRVAVEDYLGAGAVLAHLDASKSPEAEVCEAAFRAVAGRLEDVLLRCGSGVELCGRGHSHDVRQAARLNVYTAVPRVTPGGFIATTRPPGVGEVGVPQ